METAVVTIRVPADIKARLDTLADATQRSKSFLAGEAIRQYLDLEAWQIGEIGRAIAEADAGDFASTEDMEAVARKYAA